MRAGLGIDQLPGDAHPLACFAHRAFQNIANPQLAPDLFHVDAAAFVGEGRVAAITKSQQMRESAVMISSTIPSTKYSCSGSPLMLAKGNTAIDGLPGMARLPGG